MAEIYLYLFVYLTVHTNPVTDIPSPRVEPKNAYEVLDSLFDAQLTIKEKTGKNDGYWVEEFLKSVGRKKGDAWCAAYTSYNLQYLNKKGYNVKYVKSGWSPDWAKNPNWKRGQPLIPFVKGDVFSIYFANLKRPAHVGFIYKDGGNYVITQEGNTSDDNYGQATREGNKVARKKRLKKQLYTVKRFINGN